VDTGNIGGARTKRSDNDTLNFAILLLYYETGYAWAAPAKGNRRTFRTRRAGTEQTAAWPGVYSCGLACAGDAGNARAGGRDGQFSPAASALCSNGVTNNTKRKHLLRCLRYDKQVTYSRRCVGTLVHRGRRATLSSFYILTNSSSF